MIIGGITMRKDVLWRKIGRIIMMLSEELDISPARALNLFYNTETCKQLSDERIKLRLNGMPPVLYRKAFEQAHSY